MQTRPENRVNFTLGFPARRESFKGFDDAVKAAAILRQRYGEKLRVTAFGADRGALPDWIEWLHYPSTEALRDFYNHQAVFMLPSHFEGWGLTGIEALACGAALIATDNGGSRDYAIHAQTALVVPPKRPEELAAAVARLFDNDALRIDLALTGHEYVQRYTWEGAGSSLHALLTHGAAIPAKTR